MGQPIRIHPGNPKVFEFRGRPLVLLTATEHYGAVMNRPFRFERYLADAAEKQITLTRLFVLFRELQGPCNPYSTCKPESPDYIAPWPRTGPGRALDGEPRYDLDRWNPEFFDRLHRFLSLASDYGIVVEVTLLSNTYGPAVWALNPLNSANNVNMLPDIRWPEYMSLRHPDLFARQAAHVRKIVEETCAYDNVIYEICNEPGGCAPGVDDPPTCDEVNRWQAAVVQVIREAEAGRPGRHLVAGQEAFTWDPWEQSSTLSFEQFPVDVANIHPLPNTTYRSQAFDMGRFMSKELKLRPFRDYCLVTYSERKPLNFDEDNIASQYKDPDGWIIHRKRAWTALLSGAHYDVIDFSIINYCETGTSESQRNIRNWMRHLSRFVHSLDLARARPMPEVFLNGPAHALASVLAVAGEDYCVYLADERELDEEGAGSPIAGEVVLSLPAGDYRVALYSPTTGRYSPEVRLAGGPETRVMSQPFAGDVVVRLRRA